MKCLFTSSVTNVIVLYTISNAWTPISQDENRRFRIKFSGQPPHKSPLETCNDCIVELSNLLPIREMGAVSSSSSSNTAQRSSKSNDYEISSSAMSSQVPREYEDNQMFSQEPNSLMREKSTVRQQSSDPALRAVNQTTTNDIADSGYKGGSSVQKLCVGSQTTQALSHVKQAVVQNSRGNIEVPMESELMPLPAVAEVSYYKIISTCLACVAVT